MSEIPSSSFRARAIRFYGFLIFANLGAWAWAMLALHDQPLLLGTALLAYTLGLRHALDADHIAAIDNVTRKLMQDGRRPVSVGFFFALGHSTVVILASLIAYTALSAVGRQMDVAGQIGGVVGTSVSAFFLIFIAIMNLVILRELWITFRKVRKGDHAVEAGDILLPAGVLSRFLRPLFRALSSPWQMYPIGLLFGLGFDTAMQVALLGISAAAAADGLSLGAMADFPVLFTAGMTLVDTSDGILMVGAYGWAFTKPIRKLYYNLTITLVSVVVALLIGGIQAIGLIKDWLSLRGGVWDFAQSLSDNFGTLGLVIIGVSALSWIGFAIIYRVKGFEQLTSPGAGEDAVAS
jgi:high-affinity nickel-transport protein